MKINNNLKGKQQTIKLSLYDKNFKNTCLIPGGRTASKTGNIIENESLIRFSQKGGISHV